MTFFVASRDMVGAKTKIQDVYNLYIYTCIHKYMDISNYIVSTYVYIYISVYDMSNNYKEKSGQFQDEGFSRQLLESDPQVQCSA